MWTKANFLWLHTMQTLKADAEQLMREYLLSTVLNEVNHHMSVRICARQHVRFVTEEPAHTSLSPSWLVIVGEC